MSGRGTGRPALEWDVPAGQVKAADLDERLLAGAPRTTRMQVLIDHDTPTGRCPRCGWSDTVRGRDCPSRVVAKALLHNTALPAWLEHVAPAVPGARVRETRQTAEQRRAHEDGLPGLFAAPVRQQPGREGR